MSTHALWILGSAAPNESRFRCGLARHMSKSREAEIEDCEIVIICRLPLVLATNDDNDSWTSKDRLVNVRLEMLTPYTFPIAQIFRALASGSTGTSRVIENLVIWMPKFIFQSMGDFDSRALSASHTDFRQVVDAHRRLSTSVRQRTRSNFC